MKETPEMWIDRMTLMQIDDPDSWYIGGYYVGYTDTKYVPDWNGISGAMTKFKDIWELGRSDGAGDRENGW